MQDLDELESKIKKFKKKHTAAPQKSSIFFNNNSVLFNLGIELFANICVGTILGLVLDKYLDSKPICLLICLILSILAAFKVIINYK
jgi:F0F1-type ATP synthase assembly protein I